METRTEHVVLSSPRSLAQPERRSVDRATSRFAAIGVTLPGEPAGPVRIRARAGDRWTPWLEAQFESDHAPDPGTEEDAPGVASEPIWMGAADGYQIDAPREVTSAKVHLVAETATRLRLTPGAPAAGAASHPPISSRAAWGARPPNQHPSVTPDLKLAIVHHSVNSNGYAAGSVPAMLRAIQAYHQDVNGWNDIAYNFIVDRFGRIWEGRAGGISNVVTGGHSQGFNTGAVGIVVLGDFTSASPPPASMESIAHVIAWKFAHHRVDPGSTVQYTTLGSRRYAAGTTLVLPRIIGHAHVQLTLCPGPQLHYRVPSIRARVGQLLSGYQSSAPPVLTSGDLDGDGLTDAIEYHTGWAPDTIWSPTGSGTVTKTRATITRPYRPAVGDFDGDGRDDAVWHGSGSAPDVLWWSEANATRSQPFTANGSYLPFVGDFDGDRRDDIMWYGTGPAQDWIWYGNANRTFTTRQQRQDLLGGVPVIGDFGADGRDDIIWYGPGAASDRLWRSNGRGFTSFPLTVNGWYTPVAVTANGDERDDVLWVQPGATVSYRWEFTLSTSFTSRTLHTAPVAGRPTVLDFDGDGLDDVFLHAPGGAADAIWYGTATGIDARSVTVTHDYAIASGPMDADVAATDDLLLVSSGPDYLWRGKTDRTFTSTRVG
jgi:hypothetical protein